MLIKKNKKSATNKVSDIENLIVTLPLNCTQLLYYRICCFNILFKEKIKVTQLTIQLLLRL